MQLESSILVCTVCSVMTMWSVFSVQAVMEEIKDKTVKKKKPRKMTLGGHASVPCVYCWTEQRDKWSGKHGFTGKAGRFGL